MDPPVAPAGWDLLSGHAIAAALVSLVGTWPVSALLLLLYRRQVARQMRTGTAPGPAPHHARPGLRPDPSVPAPVLNLAVADPRTGGRLEELAGRSVRRAQLIFGTAGVAFGLTAVVVYVVLERLEVLPVRSLTLALLFSWPAVAAVLAQQPAGRLRTKVLVWAAYLAVVVLVPVLGGVTVVEGLMLAAGVIGVSALYAAATGMRAVRGATWLVSPTLLALSLAALAWYLPWLHLRLGVPFDVAALTDLAQGFGWLVLLAAYVGGLVWACNAKLVSDQTLLVLQWWFVAGLGLALDLVNAHGTAGLAGLAPLLVAALTLVVANRLVPLPAGQPRRLLLLRTFGYRGRSTRLLRRLTQEWRWLGSIQLITAPDSASETVGPDGFLAFLLGRLRRRVVRGPEDLARRLAEVDLRPDRDGRYRVTELLCAATAWRPAVERLIADTDVVLVDLRGLHAGNEGVAYELARLVDAVDLGRVVALVDATTDPAALHRALTGAAAAASADAPFRRGGSSVLTTLADSRARPAAILTALGDAGGAGGAPGRGSDGPPGILRISLDGGGPVGQGDHESPSSSDQRRTR